jgi:D-tyrosyl-tRNA(Tyr) deacylase
MNLSLKELAGDILLICQFTLFASTKKGNRPSFIASAKSDKAKDLYLKTIIEIEKVLEKPIQTGVFGARMQVSLTNTGPTTIIIDSKNKE